MSLVMVGPAGALARFGVRLRSELPAVLAECGASALLVTHDEEDAPGAILTLTTPCLTKEDSDLV